MTGIRRAAVVDAQNRCGYNAATTKVVLDFLRRQATAAAADSLGTVGWQEYVRRELQSRDFVGHTPLHVAAAADAADSAGLLIAESMAVAEPSARTGTVVAGSSEPQDGVRECSAAASITPAALARIRGSTAVLSLFSEYDKIASDLGAVKPMSPPSGAASAQPTILNPAAERWAKTAGWRLPADEPVPGPELRALRDWGCDSSIDVVSSLSWPEFRDKYLLLGRPVLITDPLVSDSKSGLPALLSRWRKESLLAHYGRLGVTGLSTQTFRPRQACFS